MKGFYISNDLIFNQIAVWRGNRLHKVKKDTESLWEFRELTRLEMMEKINRDRLFIHAGSVVVTKSRITLCFYCSCRARKYLKLYIDYIRIVKGQTIKYNFKKPKHCKCSEELVNFFRGNLQLILIMKLNN